jgi:hypothetical protein
MYYRSIHPVLVCKVISCPPILDLLGMISARAFVLVVYYDVAHELSCLLLQKLYILHLYIQWQQGMLFGGVMKPLYIQVHSKNPSTLLLNEIAKRKSDTKKNKVLVASLLSQMNQQLHDDTHSYIYSYVCFMVLHRNQKNAE